MRPDDVAEPAGAALRRRGLRGGVAIDDPEGRLEGTGSQVRSIRLGERAAILDDSYVGVLMAQALKVAGADLKRGIGQVVLKSKIATLNRIMR